MNFGYPYDLYFGITIGFFATAAVVLALDKFGDAMFERGVARPFFLGKYRLHHRSFLFKVVPAAYVAIAGMVIAGLVKVEWGLLWTGLAGTALVALDCLVLDLTMDYFRKGRGWGLLRHELLYSAVLVYAFAAFLRFTI
ncbi:MAG: hypothetical protein JRN57_02675 [Nitrososphaerota archaeon]|nr:hypothetical protein [Nitrososphaerota archaeon]MDG7011005.1 hypothetical protein [Nitrososphaerota archaeon]